MTLQRGYDLVERLRELGAPDPEMWAASEIEEGIPQEARYLFLRAMWEQINGWTPASAVNVAAARRAVDAGARPEDVATAMRAAAYETAFAILYRLSDGSDEGAPDDSPGWSLREVRRDGDGLALSGRVVDALHEDLLTMDPSGQEGAQLWD